MTLDEKENKYINEVVEPAAEKLGMQFIIESGEGRDLETEDMYMQDLGGWLFPKETPVEKQRSDEFYCFAEWSVVDDKAEVDFVKYEIYYDDDEEEFDYDYDDFLDYTDYVNPIDPYSGTVDDWAGWSDDWGDWDYEGIGSW